MVETRTEGKYSGYQVYLKKIQTSKVISVKKEINFHSNMKIMQCNEWPPISTNPLFLNQYNYTL